MINRPHHLALVSVAVVAVGAAGCVDDASSEQLEAEVDELLEDVETFTIRDCTCAQQAGEAAELSARFDGWPDYQQCLHDNTDTAGALGEQIGANRPFLIEYLDPHPEQPAKHYWHHDGARGTYYHGAACEGPDDSACEWRSRDFDQISVSHESHEFPGCEQGDEAVDSVMVTVNTDAQPERALPEVLLEETTSQQEQQQ